MKKKNIFLLVLDGLRPDRMSCYGYKRNTTPFIDSLAKEGLLFSNGYTVAHSSLPAHISLFTGVHPHFHRAASNHSYFNNQLPFLTEILKDNGYKTIGISTVNPYLTIECGFIRYFDKYIKVEKSNRILNSQIKGLIKRQTKLLYAKKWLREILKEINRINRRYVRYRDFRRLSDFYLRNDLGGKKIFELTKEQFDLAYDKDKPFFMFANIIEPHTPFLPPQRFRDYFGRRQITNILLDAFFDPHLFQSGRTLFSPEEQETLGILYDGGVRYTDYLVEDLFNYLDKKGYLDNTFIIIMSDHGEMLNEHDHLIGHGDSTYEGMVRIPIIILDRKESKKAQVREDLISLIDVFPTIINIAGAKLDKTKFGYKCKDLLDESSQHPFVICECTTLPFPERLYNYPEIIVGSYHVERTVIERPYKLIWRSDGRHALYDLSADKDEMYNLFDKYKNSIVKDLMYKMIDWYKEQLNERDFFSLEFFDYQIMRNAGCVIPKDIVITQDKKNIEIIQDIIR